MKIVGLTALCWAALIPSLSLCTAQPTGWAWDRTAFARSGVGFEVEATVQFDDGSGPALIVGGRNHPFYFAAGLPVGRIQRFEGVRWSDIGKGLPGSAYSLSMPSGAARPCRQDFS